MLSPRPVASTVWRSRNPPTVRFTNGEGLPPRLNVNVARESTPLARGHHIRIFREQLG
jgi:hypothetical protein